MNTDALRQMIDERLARRDKLRAQLDGLEIEIRVIQEVAVRLGGEEAAARLSDQCTAFRTGSYMSNVRVSGALQTWWSKAREEGSSEPRERALKREWVAVLKFVGGQPNRTATLTDMMDYSEMMDLGILRNTLRSQTSIYVDRGWLERVDQGVFRLTEAGAAKCGLELGVQNEEPAALEAPPAFSSEGDNLFRDPAPEA